MLLPLAASPPPAAIPLQISWLPHVCAQIYPTSMKIKFISNLTLTTIHYVFITHVAMVTLVNSNLQSLCHIVDFGVIPGSLSSTAVHFTSFLANS